MRYSLSAVLRTAFLLCVTAPFAVAQTTTFTTLMQDVLIDADLWSQQPEIMSANLGFEGIIGVPNGDMEGPARAAGGTWQSVTCTNPPARALTSVLTPSGVASTYGYPVFFADALPIVFSWPMLPSTVQATDFMLTLNDGSTVFPEVVSITPNFEYNERHIAVVFGQFANREIPTAPGAIFPRTITIVDDGTPLTLVGPNGRVSAVGLSYTMPDAAHPYVNGPYLLAAKLSTLRDIGESAPVFLTGNLPNDGISLYGDEGQYRLRLYYTGGFSPDGVRSILPTEFSRFFRVQATDSSGATILLTDTNVEYSIDGATLEILGLADLGPSQSSYDDCYVEDHDNYIDIIIKGDEAAVRRLTAVELPSTGAYDPVYTPGGPGSDPTPGVTYTSPSQPGIIGITLALDDPMAVSYTPNTPPSGYYDQSQYDANGAANLATGITIGQNTVLTNPNDFDLYSLSQVQALHVDVPLIQRDAGTGEVTLTLGLQKATDLTDFVPFPFTAPGTSVNGGKVEFKFTPLDDAAFFRVETE